MSYRTDLEASARRHLEAANVLFAGKRPDVAGYLFGVAAECAVKAMMVQHGVRSTETTSRREDPMYAHFPELRTMLRDTLKGRSSAPLWRLIHDDKFMSQWDTNMRYSAAQDIKKTWVDEWAKQAKVAVDAMGT